MQQHLSPCTEPDRGVGFKAVPDHISTGSRQAGESVVYAVKVSQRETGPRTEFGEWALKRES